MPTESGDAPTVEQLSRWYGELKLVHKRLHDAYDAAWDHSRIVYPVPYQRVAPAQKSSDATPGYNEGMRRAVRTLGANEHMFALSEMTAHYPCASTAAVVLLLALVVGAVALAVVFARASPSTPPKLSATDIER